MSKQPIVRDVMSWEESSSLSGRNYSWHRTEIHTLTGECGHTRVHRGSGPPKKFFVCKDCLAGKPRVPVVGPVGRIDQTNVRIQDPLAHALLEPGRA